MFDVDFARSHFPALSSEWAFMDNAGGSVTPRPVIERVSYYMSHYQVQLGASYPKSVESGKLVESGREAMAELMNAAPNEIIIGPSTTMNLQLIARAMAGNWEAGSEVVVTNLDHESNIGAWRFLEDRGIVVREWAFDAESGKLTLEGLNKVLSSKTKLVTFTHCANVVGAIEDIRSFVDAIHEAGALACVDGVAYAPHRLLDVRAWDVDFYAFSTYKVFGPHLGVLYGKADLLRQAKRQNHYFFSEESIPGKLQPGNVIHELTASLPGTLEYLRGLSQHHRDPKMATVERDARAELSEAFDLIANHEAALGERLLGYLRDKPGVRIIGPSNANVDERVATIGFTVDGKNSRKIVESIEESKVAVRFGDFYARRAIEHMGLGSQEGIVRVSMVHYNSFDEVDRLVGAIDRTI